jgi:hypothetical protein
MQTWKKCSIFLGSWIRLSKCSSILLSQFLLINEILWALWLECTKIGIWRTFWGLFSASQINCSKISNMRTIDQNVPQFVGFEKCSSGSKILRSQFFPCLVTCRTPIMYTYICLLNVFSNVNICCSNCPHFQSMQMIITSRF